MIEAASPSRRRPAWLVVLAAMMLLYGAGLLFTGLTTLAGTGEIPAPAGPPEQLSDQALERHVRALIFERAHPAAVRAHAASEVVLALVLLYAVAAVFSLDPRGRLAAMAAGWTGIAYHLGHAAFVLLVMRQGMLQAAPVAAELALRRQAASGGGRLPSAAEVAASMDTVILVATAVTAVVGLGFSLLVLRFFGGPRGRAFYAAGGRAQDG